MRLRYGPPTDLDDDFAGIVGRTKDLHSITRSTVPLLAWWRDYASEQLLPGVDLSSAVARFEYAVAARCAACGERAGKGKVSMTDVMVTHDARAVAIEGKYTEPRYDTVEVWRARGKDRDNRDRVRDHWCHVIEDFTGAEIDRAKVGGLVYQTLHRTASACSAAPRGGVAHVMYLAFVERDAHRNDYEKDLDAAARVLDPKGKLQFSVTSVPTAKGDDFGHVAAHLEAEETNERRMELMAEALVSKLDLYRFEEPARVRIR